MNRRGWGEEGEVTSGLVPHPSFLRDSYFSTGRHDQTQTLSDTSDTLGIHRNATSITKHTFVLSLYTLITLASVSLPRSLEGSGTDLRHLTSLPHPAATHCPPPPHATALISDGAEYERTGSRITFGVAAVDLDVGAGVGVVVVRSQRRSVESSAADSILVSRILV